MHTDDQRARLRNREVPRGRPMCAFWQAARGPSSALPVLAFQQVSTLTSRLSQRGCRGCFCSHFCEHTSHIRQLSLTGTYSAPLSWSWPGLSRALSIGQLTSSCPSFLSWALHRPKAHTACHS